MEPYRVQLAAAVGNLSIAERSELAKKVLACFGRHVTGCKPSRPCGLYSGCEYNAAKQNRMGLSAKIAKSIEQYYGGAVRRMCSVEQTYYDSIGELKPHFAEIVTHIAESIHGILRVNDDRDANLIADEYADQVEDTFNYRINIWHLCFAKQFWQSGSALNPYHWSSELAELAESAEPAELAESAEPTELAKSAEPFELAKSAETAELAEPSELAKPSTP